MSEEEVIAMLETIVEDSKRILEMTTDDRS